MTNEQQTGGWHVTRVIADKPVRYERAMDAGVVLVVNDFLGCWNWTATGITRRQSEEMPMPHHRVFAIYELARAQFAAEAWFARETKAAP